MQIGIGRYKVKYMKSMVYTEKGIDEHTTGSYSERCMEMKVDGIPNVQDI